MELLSTWMSSGSNLPSSGDGTRCVAHALPLAKLLPAPATAAAHLADVAHQQALCQRALDGGARQLAHQLADCQAVSRPAQAQPRQPQTCTAVAVGTAAHLQQCCCWWAQGPSCQVGAMRRPRLLLLRGACLQQTTGRVLVPPPLHTPERVQQCHRVELHHAVFAVDGLLHLVHPALDDLRVLRTICRQAAARRVSKWLRMAQPAWL